MSLLKELFKKIKSVSNLPQAGDATLAFYYDSVHVKDIEIVRDQRAPLGDRYFHGKKELKLWGPSVGFKKIPLLDSGTFSDSLEVLKFTFEEIEQYSHFIENGKRVSFDKENTEQEFVTIYRLDQSDYSQIVTGYF
jgi:hypothetical protein